MAHLEAGTDENQAFGRATSLGISQVLFRNIGSTSLTCTNLNDATYLAPVLKPGNNWEYGCQTGNYIITETISTSGNDGNLSLEYRSNEVKLTRTGNFDDSTLYQVTIIGK